MNDHRVAPWTDDEVASLNAYQASGAFHPFTGVNELAPDGQDDVLVATTDGWISNLDPEYRQDWCHAWMADWSWREHFAANIALLARAGCDEVCDVCGDGVIRDLSGAPSHASRPDDDHAPLPRPVGED